MSDFNASLPVRTETDGDVGVKLVDGTLTSQSASVDSSGALKSRLVDASGNILTSGSQGTQRALDVELNFGSAIIDPRSIRALTSADVITSQQGTSPWITSSLAEGSVSPGTISTKSLLVGVTYNSSLPTLTTGQQVALQSDSSGRVIVSPLTNSSTIKSQLQDNAGNGLTSSIAGSLRPLDTALRDSSGNLYTPTNPFPVQLSPGEAGTEVHNYNTVSSLAIDTSSNHDYTITSGKTFKGSKFYASSSGKIKIEVQVSPDGTTFNTKWVAFSNAAELNISIDLEQFTISDSGVGSKIRIIRTNLDKAPADVFSTISGVEL